MKKICCLFLVFCCLVPILALSSLEQEFPNLTGEEINLLKSGKALNDSTDKGGISQLAPVDSTIYKLASDAKNSEVSFSVATLAYVPYPETWQSISQIEKQFLIFSLVTQISTQKGLTYISRLAGYKPRVLFEDSYVVSDPKDKKSKLDDPIYTYLPETETLTVYQKDNRFGGNLFVVDYTTTDEEVFMKITNLTSMKYGLITCVEEGDLSMYLDTYLTEDGIVLFCMAEVQQAKTKILGIDLVSCFTRRITALQEWFVGGLGSGNSEE